MDIDTFVSVVIGVVVTWVIERHKDRPALSQIPISTRYLAMGLGGLLYMIYAGLRIWITGEMPQDLGAALAEAFNLGVSLTVPVVNKHLSDRSTKPILPALLLIIALAGCSRFAITTPDGTIISEQGAPLLNRDSTWTIEHEWLGEDNVLHQTRYTRSTNENASQQVLMMEIVRDLVKTGGAAAVAAP